MGRLRHHSRLRGHTAEEREDGGSAGVLTQHGCYTHGRTATAVTAQGQDHESRQLHQTALTNPIG